MPDMNDFHAFQSTNGDSNDNQSSGNNGCSSTGCGCSGLIGAIVVCAFAFFLGNGASWEAIEALLGVGFLAFLVGNYLV